MTGQAACEYCEAFPDLPCAFHRDELTAADLTALTSADTRTPCQTEPDRPPERGP